MFSFFRKSKPTEDQRTPSPGSNARLGSPVVFGAASPARPPEDTPSPPPPDATTDRDLTQPGALHGLISSVPAKSLHEYIVARLPQPPTSPIPLSSPEAEPKLDPTALAALAQFFTELTPPEKLHCVRCHKFYYDVENTDRSCLVPHDDESAEVERVGGGYETLWGCCERTVEGDGDMGPPDGWCYEGRHTTDPKRARFRADSSLYDDKLTSCTRLKCFIPRDPTPVSSDDESVTSSPRRKRRAANARKRTRSMVDGANQREDADEADGPDVVMGGDDNGDDDGKSDGKRSVGSSKGKRRKTTSSSTPVVPGSPSSSAGKKRKPRASSTASSRRRKIVPTSEQVPPPPLPSSSATTKPALPSGGEDVFMSDVPSVSAPPPSSSTQPSNSAEATPESISAPLSRKPSAKPRRKRAKGSDDDAVYKPSQDAAGPDSEDEHQKTDASDSASIAAKRKTKVKQKMRAKPTAAGTDAPLGSVSAPNTPADKSALSASAKPASKHKKAQSVSFLTPSASMNTPSTPLSSDGEDLVRQAQKKRGRPLGRARPLQEVVAGSVEGEAGFGSMHH